MQLITARQPVPRFVDLNSGHAKYPWTSFLIQLPVEQTKAWTKHFIWMTSSYILIGGVLSKVHVLAPDQFISLSNHRTADNLAL